MPIRYALFVCLMRNWTWTPSSAALAQNGGEPVFVVRRVLAVDPHEVVDAAVHDRL